MSFKTKLMNPFTAYIVVETEEQKTLLLKKQNEAVNGNKNLDLDSGVRQMSEPNLYILAFLLTMVLFTKRRFFS
jgi:hypothetical protein